MKHLLLILFISYASGMTVVIPPSLYISDLQAFAERQSITYTVVANSSISVFLMDYTEFYQYSKGGPVIYDYTCSRLSIKAADVSCNYTSESRSPSFVYDVYFVVQNESNETSVNVNYTLTYKSESKLVLFMLFVSIVSVLVLLVSCMIHLLCKDKVRE